MWRQVNGLGGAGPWPRLDQVDGPRGGVGLWSGSQVNGRGIRSKVDPLGRCNRDGGCGQYCPLMLMTDCFALNCSTTRHIACCYMVKISLLINLADIVFDRITRAIQT